MPPPLLSIRDLKVHFDLGGGTAWDRMTGGSRVRRVVHAVDGVDLDIRAGRDHWAWSASRAAASRRSGAPSCGWSSRRPAR